MHPDKIKIAVLGLGYVGLPLAEVFAKHYPVIGYDVNKNLVDSLKVKKSKDEGLVFTCSADQLEDCTVFIIAVPTPVDDTNQPDLRALLSASRTVAQYLKKGDYVIYESTVYPGCTEEECVPILVAAPLGPHFP